MHKNGLQREEKKHLHDSWSARISLQFLWSLGPAPMPGTLAQISLLTFMPWRRDSGEQLFTGVSVSGNDHFRPDSNWYLTEKRQQRHGKQFGDIFTSRKPFFTQWLLRWLWFSRLVTNKPKTMGDLYLSHQVSDTIRCFICCSHCHFIVCVPFVAMLHWLLTTGADIKASFLENLSFGKKKKKKERLAKHYCLPLCCSLPMVKK